MNHVTYYYNSVMMMVYKGCIFLFLPIHQKTDKMRTKIELIQDITSITTTIHQKYPELSKYIIEMPTNNKEDVEINIENLKEYYHSLKVFLDKYSKTHHIT